MKPLRLLFTLCVAVVMVACREQPDTGPDPDGPLRTVAREGASSAYAPRGDVAVYDVTFGGFVLCLTDRRSGPATLTDVHPARAGQKIAAVYIRTVTPAMVQAHPDEESILIGSMLGSPPFDQPYVHERRPVGDFTTKIRGAVITDYCDQAESAARSAPPDHAGGPAYTELMLVISATSEESGVVNGFVIEYSANGKKYAMSVPVKMIACDRTRRMWACR
jgi:hypothetical protein